MLDLNSPEALARSLAEAVRTSNWRALAVLGLVFTVWLLRRFGGALPRLGPFIRSDRGGALLALLVGFGGAVFTALLGKIPIDAQLLYQGAGVAATGAGFWAMLRKILPLAVVDPEARTVLHDDVAFEHAPALPRGAYFHALLGRAVHPGTPEWDQRTYEALSGESWEDWSYFDRRLGRRIAPGDVSWSRETYDRILRAQTPTAAVVVAPAPAEPVSATPELTPTEPPKEG